MKTPFTTVLGINVARCATVLVAAGALASGALVASAAAAGSPTHTLQMTSVQTADAVIGGVDVASDRDVHNGKTVGFDATSCVIDQKMFRAVCDVAVARSRGMLYGHVSINLKTRKGSGMVTGGTGAFKGSVGTISVAPGPNPSSPQITIVYRV